jgi:hypothetical protein
MMLRITRKKSRYDVEDNEKKISGSGVKIAGELVQILDEEHKGYWSSNSTFTSAIVQHECHDRLNSPQSSMVGIKD